MGRAGSSVLGGRRLWADGFEAEMWLSSHMGRNDLIFQTLSNYTD